VLNLKYLGKNRATDVMAFDISKNKAKILADIVISGDTAVKNSKEFKTSSLYEAYLYVIHGVLHILGYDDETAQQRKIMEYKAQRILKTLPGTWYPVHS
jgi:probable rRNA maturation factor